MCLLICVRNDDGSMVVAANRDERYDRPAREPFVWAGSPRVLAGQDALGGGTWLAVNEHGVVAAITNRATEEPAVPPPGKQRPLGASLGAPPTRGRLPLLACQFPSAAEARAALAGHLAAERYNGFNLFVADARDAFLIQAPTGRLAPDGSEGALEAVPAGAHVVGNGQWDDPSDARVARAHRLLAEVGLAAAPGLADADAAIARLQRICRDHRGQGTALALCLHGAAAGTVSSTILTLDSHGKLGRYLYVSDPPCQGEYRELSF